MAKVSIDLRKVALHERSQSQAANELYDAFVAPFANIFKAVKLTVTDIASLAWGALDWFFSLDPAARAQAVKSYTDRQDKINGEWRKLEDDLKFDDDAKLVAFLLNPAGYMGINAAKLGFETAEGVLDLATPIPTKIKQFFGDVFPGSSSRKDGEDRGGRSPFGGVQPGDAAVLIRMYRDLIKYGPTVLNRLFMKDPSLAEGRLSIGGDKRLLQEESGNERVSAITKGFGLDEPWIKNQLDLVAANVIASKRMFANQMLDAYLATLDAIEILRSVDDVKKLKPAFNKLAELQPDLQSKLASTLQTLDAKAKKLAATPEFKQDNPKLSADAPEEDVFRLAQSALIASLVTELSSKFEEAASEFAERLHDDVFFDWPTKKQLAAMPQNEFTKQAIQLMDEFDGRLRNIDA